MESYFKCQAIDFCRVFVHSRRSTSDAGILQVRCKEYPSVRMEWSNVVPWTPTSNESLGWSLRVSCLSKSKTCDHMARLFTSSCQVRKLREVPRDIGYQGHNILCGTLYTTQGLCTQQINSLINSLKPENEGEACQLDLATIACYQMKCRVKQFKAWLGLQNILAKARKAHQRRICRNWTLYLGCRTSLVVDSDDSLQWHKQVTEETQALSGPKEVSKKYEAASLVQV